LELKHNSADAGFPDFVAENETNRNRRYIQSWVVFGDPFLLCIRRNYRKIFKENPEERLSPTLKGGDLRKKTENYQFSAQK